MKKFLPALVLISFLAFLVMPQAVLANDIGPPDYCTITRDLGLGDNCPGEGVDCEFTDEDYSCGMCCLIQTFYSITDWVFVILMAFVMIMVIMGAFVLMTSAGAPEKVTSGRNYIFYAAIGMLVGLLAKAVPALVKAIAGF